MKLEFFIYNPTIDLRKRITLRELNEMTNLSASDLDDIIQSRTRLSNIGFILPSNTKEEVFNELFSKEHIDETWKLIKREGCNYEISSYGRVRKIKDNGKKGPTLKNHTRGGNKSFSVQLTISGKKKWELVHRLVAEHFIEEFDPNKDVFHLDGIYTNNHYSNLKCMEKSEIGKLTAIKTRNKKPKIIAIDTFTGKTLGAFSSTREVEKELGLGRQSVLDNLNGKTNLSYNRYIFTYETKSKSTNKRTPSK